MELLNGKELSEKLYEGLNNITDKNHGNKYKR